MGQLRTDEFRKDAVRIALTSGLTRRQVADGLGVGLSILNKWLTLHRDTDVATQENRDLSVEKERLRRENRLSQVLNVSTCSLLAFRNRPASRKQHTDTVVLANIREQSRLNLGSYGRPRMTEDLKD